MARRKCIVLLLLCATCTLASDSSELLNILNEDASEIRTRIPADYTNIVEQFTNSVDPCDNAYSIACDNSNTAVENKAISLKTVRKYFLETLYNPLEKSDLAPLRIEKQLFRNCMNLGKETRYDKERMVTEFEYSMHRISSSLSPDSPWQILDILLSSIDFGHFFYDIKVESHPDDRDVNVITLQPPSYIHIERMNELIRLILDSSNDSVYDQQWNVWKYFETVKINYKNEIESFFSSLLKIMSTSLEESTQKSKKGINKYVEETTLASWQINNDLYTSGTAQINWTRVISEEFKNVETEISSDDFLFVKNKHYFFNLYELLNSTSNDLISTVILTNLLAELLPYVDWNSFHALKPVKKEDFCFKETKLYATSFVTLERIRKENINGFSAIDFGSGMLVDMTGVMLEELQESQTLSLNERMYLEDEFLSIIGDAFGVNFPKEEVADIYTDYQFVGIYFKDILNYRKMIRMNELNKMDDELEAPIILDRMYSIVDLHKPSNRFLTKLLTINTTLDNPFIKEIFYSKYAPDVAQFFYSLLNENKFVDYKHHFKGDELELHTYPIFAFQTEDCHSWHTLNGKIFKNKKIVKNMMTSMFGLHFAYKMFLKNHITWDEPEGRISKWITSKKMFFISYLKNHCSLGKEFLDEFISRLDVAMHTHLCKNHAKKRTTCRQEPFEIQSKSIFLRHSRLKNSMRNVEGE